MIKSTFFLPALESPYTVTGMEFSLLPAKAALRAQLRACRISLSPPERLALSEKAARRLLDSAVWRKARSVALYVAVRGETDTTLLLDEAWRDGKDVLLPVCPPEEPGAMRLVSASGWADLAPGPFGIPEPACTGDERRNTGRGIPGAGPELFVVPGVAFDRRGCRLGQGGGCYDRLFGRCARAGGLRVGFSYSFQLVERLPCDAWDVPVHAVCTDEGILWMEKS